MKTSKIIFALFTVFFFGATLFNAQAEDDPSSKKKSSTKKESKKQPTKIAYTQAEETFIAEIDEYFVKKYSNPLHVFESKLEKVIVVDANGKVVQELSVPDHKEHEAQLPVGASKLMVRGNTAYYMVLQ
jgi:biopolymer transport protein ExbD